MIVAQCVQIMTEPATSLRRGPDIGCYIRGLFIEGARWDPSTYTLNESRPKELFTEMPCIWLVPEASRQKPSDGFYLCPVYKTLTRAGKCTLVHCLKCARSSAIYLIFFLKVTEYAYTCVYVCLGTLSTTGHSTNYVFAIEVPSQKAQTHWIQRGVAMLCALNY